MKARIISTLLCLIVLAGTVGLVLRFPSSFENQNAPAPSTEEIETEAETAEPIVTASSRNFVIKTAHDAEDLLKELAYGKTKEYEDPMANLVLRLDQSADYLKDELQDYYGATYFAKIADLFGEVLSNPFNDAATFGTRVSKMLTELENMFPTQEVSENDPNTPMYYPKFDTDANGTTTLAMLSIYRQQYQKSTGAVLLSFGGNVVIGDTLLGIDGEDSFKKQQENSFYPYPFYKLSSVLKTDGVSFLNLESALTESVVGNTASGVVKGLPSYAEHLKNNGIDVLSIANPGAMGYGASGKEDTKQALIDAKLSFTDEGTVAYVETAIGTAAYISYDITEEVAGNSGGAFIDAPKQDIAAAKAAGAKLVIINFNWITTEKNKWDPCMAQVLTTRAAIDNGASLVIGSHPDSIQAIERYKNACVVYSTGNIFKKGAEDDVAFLFQQAFKLDENGKAVPGEIQILPITGNTSGNAPSFAFDTASVDTLKNKLTNVSKTVKYGLGKKADFTLNDIQFITIQK